jgi:hypothetical protein
MDVRSSRRPSRVRGKLKLTVNEEKTRICTAPEGEFDFLGYTFGRMFSARTGQARIATAQAHPWAHIAQSRSSKCRLIERRSKSSRAPGSRARDRIRYGEVEGEQN